MKFTINERQSCSFFVSHITLLSRSFYSTFTKSLGTRCLFWNDVFYILLTVIFDLIYRNEFDKLWIIKKLVTKRYAILVSTTEYSILYYTKHNIF